MNESGRTINARVRNPLWLPLVVVWLAQCGADDEPVQDFFPEIVVAKPGDTLAIFPPPGDTSLILARVNALRWQTTSRASTSWIGETTGPPYRPGWQPVGVHGQSGGGAW